MVKALMYQEKKIRKNAKTIDPAIQQKKEQRLV